MKNILPATEVLAAQSRLEERHAVQRAAALLRRGQLVIFPTETVYGVAALPSAARHLYAAKGREGKKPVAFLVSSLRQALSLCAPVPRPVRAIMNRFWPGPLTLVLPGRKRPGQTVGLRFPDHRLALKISREVGRPILLTSANRSGGRNPLSVMQAVRGLGGRAALALDGGRIRQGSPSTVFSWTPQGHRVLRKGKVSGKDLERYFGSH